MRLQLVVCLCLWIPVAQSFGGHAPEDQDGSGDDEFSGSGSGDFDIWFSEPKVTFQADPNTTKTPWIADAPVNLPERSVTRLAKVVTETETSDHVSEALLPYTTQTMETQPSLFINKSFGSVEDQKGETTTITTVAQTETTVAQTETTVAQTETTVAQTETTVAQTETTVAQTETTVAQTEITVPPAVKLPLVPMQEDKYTTAAKDEEDTTESSVTEQVVEETTVVESVSVTTEPPDMATTPLLLSITASPSDLADTEASGDSVEVTTVQGIGEDFIETNIIPEDREHVGKPRLNDNDFDFENEIQKTGLNSDLSGSGSDFARGSASDNDSLLERKEVLAGVIAGGVVGLAFAIMLVALMVYRMKKKDEGSYSLDEHKHPNGGYQKPQKQEEFLA